MGKKNWLSGRSGGSKKNRKRVGDIEEVGINQMVTYTYITEPSSSLRAIVEVSSTDTPAVVENEHGECGVLRLIRPPGESWDGDESEEAAIKASGAIHAVRYPEWVVVLPNEYPVTISLQSEKDLDSILKGPSGENYKRSKKMRFEFYDTTKMFALITDLIEVIAPFAPDASVNNCEVGRMSFYCDVVGHLAQPNVNQDPNVLLRKKMRKFLAPLTSN